MLLPQLHSSTYIAVYKFISVSENECTGTVVASVVDYTTEQCSVAQQQNPSNLLLYGNTVVIILPAFLGEGATTPHNVDSKNCP